MPKTALFPGSFDPFTIGHLALIQRAVKLFDKIIVAVGINNDKKGLYPIEERIEIIKKATSNLPQVEVATYNGLTTDFCREKGASCILRGVRSSLDFEYEKNIAEINMELAPDIETMFLISEPQYSAISSSMIRELKSFGKDVSKYTFTPL